MVNGKCSRTARAVAVQGVITASGPVALHQQARPTYARAAGVGRVIVPLNAHCGRSRSVTMTPTSGLILPASTKLGNPAEEPLLPGTVAELDRGVGVSAETFMDAPARAGG
jgi:hypothetical protein